MILHTIQNTRDTKSKHKRLHCDICFHSHNIAVDHPHYSLPSLVLQTLCAITYFHYNSTCYYYMLPLELTIEKTSVDLYYLHVLETCTLSQLADPSNLQIVLTSAAPLWTTAHTSKLSYTAVRGGCEEDLLTRAALLQTRHSKNSFHTRAQVSFTWRGLDS